LLVVTHLQETPSSLRTQGTHMWTAPVPQEFLMV